MRTGRLKVALGGACAAFALATVATSCTPAAVVPMADAGMPRPAPAFAVGGAAGRPGLAGAAEPASTGKGEETPDPSGAPSTGPSADPTASPSASPSASAPAPPTGADLPYPAHVVIVVLENHSPHALGADAPYLTSLGGQGASFTDATALRHPSEPNYLLLFSGSTHGVTDDSCPHTFSGPNLASTLADAGETFAGYSESMPSDGYTGCSKGRYARKHNPWVNFDTVPATANLTFDRFPQGHFRDLPTVSFVIPDMCHNMHDCSVATGDAWLATNLDAYATWARKHNSVLIITADESESSSGPNRVPLVVIGARVRPGVYDEPVTHLSVLRTIEDMYGLPCLARACAVQPITDIWSPAPNGS